MDKSFTQSFDGLVWAEQFVKIASQNPEIATDVETMHGWFANAIMRGYDEAHRLMCKDLGVSAAVQSKRPPFESFKFATCRGSLALGSACGNCERCDWERQQRNGYAYVPKDTQERE